MNISIIKETDLYKLNFPACVCVYKNNKKRYSMAEINTGLYKSSIKIISNIYNTYDELKKSYDINDTNYPVIFDYIIYSNL